MKGGYQRQEAQLSLFGGQGLFLQGCYLGKRGETKPHSIHWVIIVFIHFPNSLVAKSRVFDSPISNDSEDPGQFQGWTNPG